MNSFLGFIATWKLALVHDLAELLPRADHSRVATQAGPKGKVQVEAKELLATYAWHLQVRVESREKRVRDYAVRLDQERFKGHGHMVRTLGRQRGQEECPVAATWVEGVT
jgi:hypothetical protein